MQRGPPHGPHLRLPAGRRPGLPRHHHPAAGRCSAGPAGATGERPPKSSGKLPTQEGVLRTTFYEGTDKDKLKRSKENLAGRLTVDTVDLLYLHL